MKKYITLMFVFLLISGCSTNQSSVAIDGIVDTSIQADQCLDLDSFNKLANSIEKGGKKADKEDAVEISYKVGDVNLLHRMPREGFTAISVAETEKEVFYWVVKDGNSVSIQTKDYTKEVGERKYIEAQNHFCSLIKVVK